MDNNLNDAIIQLHDIARVVEQEIGKGQLSDDIRKCADRLQVLLTPIKDKE
jgi:hypothetical protein